MASFYLRAFVVVLVGAVLVSGFPAEGPRRGPPARRTAGRPGPAEPKDLEPAAQGWGWGGWGGWGWGGYGGYYGGYYGGFGYPYYGGYYGGFYPYYGGWWF